MKIPIILVSALLSVSLAIGIISVGGSGLINGNVSEIRSINGKFIATVDHEIPKIRNVLSMDIYAKDAAKDVLDYVKLNVSYVKLNVSREKEEFYKNAQAFRTLLSVYKNSTSDFEEGKLLDQLDTVFTDFQKAGNELIATQDAQVNKIENREKLLNDKIEVIINDLQKKLNPSEADFAKKQAALMEMENSLHQIALSSMTYLMKSDAVLKDRVNDSVRDFEYWENQFSVTSLTDEERKHINALKKYFKSVKASNLEIFALEDQKLELLQKFEKYENKLNDTLSNELEPIAIRKISEVEGSAIKKISEVEGSAIDSTNMRLAAIIVVIISATVLGLVISHSISNPIIKLRDAFNEIAKGNLNVKVEPHGNKEISTLYESFNSMVDKLKDHDKLQKEFISVASHELRSPIQPILSFADLAKKGQISQDQAWSSVLAQSRRLQRLANDILYVTRIEAGDLSYIMKKVKINDVILDVVNAEKVNLSEGVSIETSLDNDVEIYADTDRITQALTNIIGNAIKFTKKGHIKVGTHVIPRKNKVEIRISDTAGGIPNDVLPKLFGKFVTKSVGSENQHGTGLGLYISKAVVTAHRGEISAYNNDEGGATFVVVLPFEHELKLKSSTFHNYS